QNAHLFGVSGDFFGLVNSLFTALAFAMFLVTLLMQRYELKQQRIELGLTRNIFEGQKAELVRQNEAVRSQSVESTFFAMLRLFGETVDSIQTGPAGQRGRQRLGAILTELKEAFIRAASLRYDTEGDLCELYKTVYNNFYIGIDAEVGHY